LAGHVTCPLEQELPIPPSGTIAPFLMGRRMGVENGLGAKQLRMTFVLRLLAVMFWLGASIGLATAQTSEEESPLLALERMFFEIEVSCDGLVVAEFDDWESIFKSGVKPRRIEFNPTTCAMLFKPTQFTVYIQPLLNFAAKWQLGQPPLDKFPGSASETDRENRRAQSNYEMGVMQDSLQKNIAPLVSICRQMGSKTDDRSIRVCYLGVPGASAGLRFRSLFRTMFNNAQSMDETVCAPDPITQDKAIVPEIRDFLDAGEKSLTWPQVQDSLRGDGFACRGEGYLGRCSRGFVMLAIAPSSKLTAGTHAQWPSDSDAVIIPRQLSIYKGYWQKIGPSTCLVGSGDKDPDGCRSPSRGSESGICTAGEDWHVWGHVLFLFNKVNESH
jgi:hypothetical protein